MEAQLTRKALMLAGLCRLPHWTQPLVSDSVELTPKVDNKEEYVKLNCVRYVSA